MPDKSLLSHDQIARIEATLKRIRAGLNAPNSATKEEPATMFNPEAFNDRRF